MEAKPVAHATLVVEIGPLNLYFTEIVDPGMLPKIWSIDNLLMDSGPSLAEADINSVSLVILEDIVPILRPTKSYYLKDNLLDLRA